MFNAKYLLGHLLKQGLVKQGLSQHGRSMGHGAAGLGLMGAALAAYEQFAQKSSAGALKPGAVPSPPPPASAPGASAPSNAGADMNPEQQAMLLIRAMIAAANADHEISPEERATIVRQVATSGAGKDAEAFLTQELNSPPDVRALVKAVNSPALAEQFYAVSLAAIEVDTPAERDYLERLAWALNLPKDAVDRLHRQFNVNLP